VEDLGGEFLGVADFCKNDCWLIGLDTEGGGATLQIASKEEGRSGFQIWQLKSCEYSHCMQNGPPPSLIKILTHRKAIFVGKQIQEDIDKLCEILKLTREQRQQIKTIELTAVYMFCRTLAKKPTSLRSWVWNPRTPKDYSLKYIYNFSDEGSTIDKRAELRWRSVRWDKSPFPAKTGQDQPKRKGHPLKIKNKVYAVTDAEASRLTVVNIFKKLKIRPSLLTQLMNSPHFLFQNDLAELIEAFNGNNQGRPVGSEAFNLATVEKELKKRVERVELAEFIKREEKRQFHIMKKKERGETPHTPIYWARDEKRTRWIWGRIWRKGREEITGWARDREVVWEGERESARERKANKGESTKARWVGWGERMARSRGGDHGWVEHETMRDWKDMRKPTNHFRTNW
jgi:hypothetical protein